MACRLITFPWPNFNDGLVKKKYSQEAPHSTPVRLQYRESVIRSTHALCYAPANTFLNTLGPRQNGRYFPDDIFECIFMKENIWIPIKISLKFVPKSPINNIPALYQIMAWRRPGDKPLSEPMLVRLPTHICVTRPQWVNKYCVKS